MLLSFFCLLYPVAFLFEWVRYLMIVTMSSLSSFFQVYVWFIIITHDCMIRKLPKKLHSLKQFYSFSFVFFPFPFLSFPCIHSPCTPNKVARRTKQTNRERGDRWLKLFSPSPILVSARISFSQTRRARAFGWGTNVRVLGMSVT